jgi:hypothetical protein
VVGGGEGDDGGGDLDISSSANRDKSRCLLADLCILVEEVSRLCGMDDNDMVRGMEREDANGGSITDILDLVEPIRCRNEVSV